jgi:hypothetical protein
MASSLWKAERAGLEVAQAMIRVNPDWTLEQWRQEVAQINQVRAYPHLKRAHAKQAKYRTMVRVLNDHVLSLLAKAA